MDKLATIILYDAGFKDSAPALLSLANQTIIDSVQVIWIEYYKTIFPKVMEFDFITPTRLNMSLRQIFNISYCYNAGLMLAKGKYFTLIDPCLWFPPNFLELIYKYHEKHGPNLFTYNHELRGYDRSHRSILTKTCPPDLHKFFGEYKVPGRLKTNNLGCASTSLTRYFKEVNGFDIFDRHRNLLVDRNSLGLCVFRMVNKFGIDITVLPQVAYHSWHPVRGTKHTKLLQAKLREYKENSSITQAEKGLTFMNETFRTERFDNIIEFRRRNVEAG